MSRKSSFAEFFWVNLIQDIGHIIWFQPSAYPIRSVTTNLCNILLWGAASHIGCTVSFCNGRSSRAVWQFHSTFTWSSAFFSWNQQTWELKHLHTTHMKSLASIFASEVDRSALQHLQTNPRCSVVNQTPGDQRQAGCSSSALHHARALWARLNDRQLCKP
jgi:hypothetical protein